MEHKLHFSFLNFDHYLGLEPFKTNSYFILVDTFFNYHTPQFLLVFCGFVMLQFQLQCLHEQKCCLEVNWSHLGKVKVEIFVLVLCVLDEVVNGNQVLSVWNFFVTHVEFLLPILLLFLDLGVSGCDLFPQIYHHHRQGTHNLGFQVLREFTEEPYCKSRKDWRRHHPFFRSERKINGLYSFQQTKEGLVKFGTVLWKSILVWK